MFALYCPRHGHQVLLGLSQLVRLNNLDEGVILIEARCYDGELLVGVTGTRSVLPPEAVGHRPAVSATAIRTGAPVTSATPRH